MPRSDPIGNMAGKLESLWLEALDATASAVPSIDGPINHRQTSIRFCLLTQLLGKLTDNSVDTMCLQRSDGGT